SPAPSRSPDASPATRPMRSLRPCGAGAGWRPAAPSPVPARSSPCAPTGTGSRITIRALPQQRPFAAFDEVQHGAHIAAASRRDLLELAPRLVELGVAHVQRAVGAADGGDARCIEA